jgi:chitinase
LDHQQGRDFLALLASARLHLPADEYILSAALPQWTFRYIDLPRANNYLDFLNLMAYDFYGPWTPTAGHHAQLHSGNLREPSGGAAVAHIKSTGFPSTKLLLGIPVYGRSFLGANGPGDAYLGSGGEEGTYEYKRLPSTGSQEAVDIGRVAAYCRGGDGGFISYDNVETVAAKARFCKMERLGVRTAFSSI